MENTAAVTTANDGDDTDTAIVDVDCAAIDVDKTADAEEVTAGEPIGFTVTLANTGEGRATGLEFTDVLPAGFAWAISPDAAGWSIAGGRLVYAPAALEAGAIDDRPRRRDRRTPATAAWSRTPRRSTTANDGSDSATATVEVLCGDIALEKVADAAAVDAGSPIGFTLTAANAGTGEARGVVVKDALPARPGLDWTVDAQGSDAGCAIAGGTLTCDFGAIAGGASRSVHITSPTTAASCGAVDNTGTVTTANDGSGEASASTSVRCPVVPVPAIDIEKTGPATAQVGDVLHYTLTVTQPRRRAVPGAERRGDGPAVHGAAGAHRPRARTRRRARSTAATVDLLVLGGDDGQPAGTFVNRANVTGTDGNGRTVSDTDDFPTELAAQQVIPGNVVKGTARLSGPSGCVKKAFNATVRGRRIAKVTFFVDGRKVADAHGRTGQRTFRYTVRPNGLARGVHRITARVRFVAASETRSRTLRLTFQRCKRQVVTPRFTG